MSACAKPSSKSWFLQVQGIFLLYNLPHPITFLENPPSKFSFKRLVKAAVLDHWQDKLRMQASMLSSLEFFKPAFMSLSTTHPIFTTCGGSPYQVVRATVQARFLSGRARVESLTRHWDNTNREGYCLLFRDLNPVLCTMEDLILSGGCPSLAEARCQCFHSFKHLWSFVPTYCPW